jgi:hypothetical protein
LSGRSHNFPLKATISHFRGVNRSGQALNLDFSNWDKDLKAILSLRAWIYKINIKQLDKICTQREI